ncbi:MAG: PilZ domain-containing protein [Myxococcota bacterium]
MLLENRSERRVTCNARFLGATSTVLRGDILDISSSGLCLGLDASLDRGRELHLEFDLPAGRVDAVGEVRWTVEKEGRVELGVRFVRISSESLAVIAQATAPLPVSPRGGFGWTQLVFRR